VDHATLTHALRIPGAAAISVISVDRRTAIWTLTAGHTDDTTDFTARVAEVAGVANRLARAADGGSPLEDVLLIDPSRFHLLRVVDDADGAALAVHLILDRRVANLALARREFASVVDAHAATSHETPPDPAPWPATSWFDFFAEEPFANDDDTLERVLTALRRLER
jgi:hypothetical protein